MSVYNSHLIYTLAYFCQSCQRKMSLYRKLRQKNRTSSPSSVTYFRKLNIVFIHAFIHLSACHSYSPWSILVSWFLRPHQWNRRKKNHNRSNGNNLVEAEWQPIKLSFCTGISLLFFVDLLLWYSLSSASYQHSITYW